MNSLYIINGNGHLMGRLASVCAKELLNGKKIIVVKSEQIEISGKEIKNKYRYLCMYKKKTSTNPKRGPFHFRSPAQIFWKVIRGMLPHKTKRGTNALMNLRIYEGIPPLLNTIKKFVVPKALRVLKLSANRKYTKLGNIANHIGWTKKTLLQKMNNHSEVKTKLYYINKKILVKKKMCELIKPKNLNIYEVKV